MTWAECSFGFGRRQHIIIQTQQSSHDKSTYFEVYVILWRAKRRQDSWDKNKWQDLLKSKEGPREFQHCLLRGSAAACCQKQSGQLTRHHNDYVILVFDRPAALLNNETRRHLLTLSDFIAFWGEYERGSCVPFRRVRKFRCRNALFSYPLPCLSHRSNLASAANLCGSCYSCLHTRVKTKLQYCL